MGAVFLRSRMSLSHLGGSEQDFEANLSSLDHRKMNSEQDEPWPGDCRCGKMLRAVVSVGPKCQPFFGCRV
jgi:hypothetical protein